MLSLMFLVYSTKHSAHSENRDHRMRQVVAYKQRPVYPFRLNCNRIRLFLLM